jgi:tetratricopeptide (TPR) repeat protein
MYLYDMTYKFFAHVSLLASALVLSVSSSAAEPTIHEVYVAAEAGKYTEAQTMMNQVLQAHPNSSTVHFVEAELLVKQGKFAAALQSLRKAEELSPGLPKVKPEAVGELKKALAIYAASEANVDEVSPAQLLRKQFVNNCVGRAISRKDDAASAAGFCSCAFDVLAKNLSVAEYIDLDKAFLDRRAPDTLPAFARVNAKLAQCKK